MSNLINCIDCTEIYAMRIYRGLLKDDRIVHPNLNTWILQMNGKDVEVQYNRIGWSFYLGEDGLSCIKKDQFKWIWSTYGGDFILNHYIGYDRDMYEAFEDFIQYKELTIRDNIKINQLTKQ